MKELGQNTMQKPVEQFVEQKETKQIADDDLAAQKKDIVPYVKG